VVIGVGACSSGDPNADTPATITTPSFDANEIGTAKVEVGALREQLDTVVGPDKVTSVGLYNGKLLTISGPLTASDASKICEALDVAVYTDANNASLTVEISADPDSGDKLLVSRASKSTPCVETE